MGFRDFGSGFRLHFGGSPSAGHVVWRLELVQSGPKQTVSGERTSNFRMRVLWRKACEHPN